MSTEANKRTVRAFMESVDNGDFDAMRALLAPAMVAHVNSGDQAMNRDAFEGMARAMTTAFANGRHLVHTQVAEGDWVATHLTWTAINTGAFNGIPASQRPVRISASALDRLINGKIVERHVNFDVMALMSQIGAIPSAA